MRYCENLMTFREYSEEISSHPDAVEIFDWLLWQVKMIPKDDDELFESRKSHLVEIYEILCGKRDRFETNTLECPQLNYYPTMEQMNAFYFSTPALDIVMKAMASTRVEMLVQVASSKEYRQEFDGKCAEIERITRKIIDKSKRFSVDFSDDDIVITDPAYILKSSEYNSCDIYGIYGSTVYGDWSCTVFSDDGDVMGEFCADTGLVCVCRMDDRIRRAVDEQGRHCCCVIRKFTGRVELVYENDKCRVVGHGNVCFHSEQTGC